MSMDAHRSLPHVSAGRRALQIGPRLVDATTVTAPRWWGYFRPQTDQNRREAEIRASAFCPSCGDVSLNDFYPEANMRFDVWRKLEKYAIPPHGSPRRWDDWMPRCECADWYCPKCQHFFRYRYLGTDRNTALPLFIDVTEAWMDAWLGMCPRCTGFLAVRSTEPPVYSCRSCGHAVPADLRRIRADALRRY